MNIKLPAATSRGYAVSVWNGNKNGMSDKAPAGARYLPVL